MGRNIELLPFARPVSQIKCPLNVSDCAAAIALIVGGDSQRGQRHRKIGVEFDGALQMRDRGRVVKPLVLRLSQAESLQSVQRRRSSRLQRCGELLNRTDGLAQLSPQAGCGPVQRLQHLLLTFRLGLLTRQTSHARCNDLQGNHVMAAETGNRTRQHGLDTFAQADLAGHSAGYPLLGGAPHEAQGFMNPRFRENVQIGRLLQLHRQSLFQRPVENSVAGGVHKISEQYAVFLRQRRGWMRTPVETTRDQRGQYDKDHRHENLQRFFCRSHAGLHSAHRA